MQNCKYVINAATATTLDYHKNYYYYSYYYYCAFNFRFEKQL